MKKFLSLLLCVSLVLCFCSCADNEAPDKAGTEARKTELTLWTYPVGGWGNMSTLSTLAASFQKDYPNIGVTIKTLDYTNGDSEVETAINEGGLPDLIFEGPERLVANWGDRGLMVDLADIWDDAVSGEIYDSVRVACHDSAGRYYIYPVCMTTHCMAINRDLFEAAGAWQYIDEENHTWTTDGFISAVEALKKYGVENVASVYCGGQGGDQGTRALVNNLYSGSFTNPGHTKYTFDSEANIRALELLRRLDGINFDPDIAGADELEKFCNGELAMSFCWNVSMEINQTISNPNLDFDIFPMTFPTDDGDFNLQGGIWGFGIFDNGDADKIEAAKTFIRYMTDDSSRYTRSVLTSTYWPVRDMPDIYVNDKNMMEYSIFQQYMGDYYQVTPGWAEARTAWWNMLQRVGNGEDIAGVVAEFAEKANSAANQSLRP